MPFEPFFTLKPMLLPGSSPVHIGDVHVEEVREVATLTPEVDEPQTSHTAAATLIQSRRRFPFHVSRKSWA